MSALPKSSSIVYIISTVGRFKAYGASEIFCGFFDGHPLVSVYDPVTKKGGVCWLKLNHLALDFERWLDAAKREFGANALTSPNIQVKFVVTQRDEQVIKDLCAKAQINPSAVAAVDDKARLDVFFYTDVGRLRIAPSAKAMKEMSKPWVWKKEKQKTKVLIVDDSKTMRSILRRILGASPEIEVVGEAELPSQVEALLKQHNPDVMTLDINMPEMSGVELLKRVLAHKFIPTVMISSLSIDEGNDVLNALEIGAVDYIQKPAASEIGAITASIQEKILAASKVKSPQSGDKHAQHRVMEGAVVARGSISKTFGTSSLIAIGASTGGTEAIKKIFVQFPKEIPPIVVVQHIPPYFSTAFANRLNELCKFEVREAQDGDEVRPGRALIAPGGMHMEVKREGRLLIARLSDAPPVNRFKPSVDVLFNSVAQTLAGKATGVLLTGMGSDGARGLLVMKNAGAFTITQDEESSVVYGMPRAAFEMGASTAVEALEDIPEILMAMKAAA